MNYAKSGINLQGKGSLCLVFTIKTAEVRNKAEKVVYCYRIRLFVFISAVYLSNKLIANRILPRVV